MGLDAGRSAATSPGRAARTLVPDVSRSGPTGPARVGPSAGAGAPGALVGPVDEVPDRLGGPGHGDVRLTSVATGDVVFGPPSRRGQEDG